MDISDATGRFSNVSCCFGGSTAVEVIAGLLTILFDAPQPIGEPFLVIQIDGGKNRKRKKKVVGYCINET